MSATLTRQRCWVHLEREAAARCPVCKRFYCRECVTEHEGKVVCAACLRDILGAAARRKGLGARGRLAATGLARTLQLTVSVLAAWFFFQMLGHWLLTTATQFHEGVVWQKQFFGGGSSEDDGINKDKNDKKADDDDDNEDKSSTPAKAGKSGGR